MQVLFVNYFQVPHWHTAVLSLTLEKEKNVGQFSKNYRTFYPNNCQGSSKYGLGMRDPGDGTNPFRIPDPGFKKAPDPGAVLSLNVDKVIQSSLFQAPALSRDS